MENIPNIWRWKSKGFQWGSAKDPKLMKASIFSFFVGRCRLILCEGKRSQSGVSKRVEQIQESKIPNCYIKRNGWAVLIK